MFVGGLGYIKAANRLVEGGHTELKLRRAKAQAKHRMDIGAITFRYLQQLLFPVM